MSEPVKEVETEDGTVVEVVGVTAVRHAEEAEKRGELPRVNPGLKTRTAEYDPLLEIREKAARDNAAAEQEEKDREDARKAAQKAVEGDRAPDSEVAGRGRPDHAGVKGGAKQGK